MLASRRNQYNQLLTHRAPERVSTGISTGISAPLGKSTSSTGRSTITGGAKKALLQSPKKAVVSHGDIGPETKEDQSKVNFTEVKKRKNAKWIVLK